MITVDRSKRIQGEDILKHPWLKNCLKKDGQEVPLDDTVLQKLKQFKGSSTLKRAALNLFVKMLNPSDVENLRKQFQMIDTDNSGFIEASELQVALKKAEKEAHASELHAILKELDYNGNEKINYTEFLAATISVQKFLTHQKLEALYRQFDVDGNNMITKENIREALYKLGKDVTEQELDEIMKKHDKSGDHAISMDEFKKMLFDDN